MCTLINSVHAALKQDDPELALGRIADAYQAMEQWATDGTPSNGMSALAWSHTHMGRVEMGAWVAPDVPKGPMRELPPLYQPATMAAYAAGLKDLVALNKAREEERELAGSK